jgi:PAS domain S-box-containing protein
MSSGRHRIRILHLEANDADAARAAAVLVNEGFTGELVRVSDRQEFVHQLRSSNWSLIIAADTAPQLDLRHALTFAKQRHPETPFIALAGPLGEEQVVELLKSGATNHVRKDGLARLGPAVRQAMREARQSAGRRKAEEALRDSEERYRRIFENAVEGIYQSTPDGRYLRVNPALVAMYGFSSAEEMINAVTNIADQIYVDPAAQIEFKNRMERFGEVRGMEYEVRRKDGRHIWISESARAVTDSQGKLLYYEGTIADITERRVAIQKIQESNRRLEEALAQLRTTQGQVIQQERLRALGQMASGVAHDLNNTLVAILGYSELLNSRPELLADRARCQHYLKTIHTAAMDAANVVSRLREFYRHRDEEELTQIVDLADVVKQAAELTQPRWKDQALADGKIIAVITECHPTLPVRGNPGDLREVLTNLIFNAVDAMPTGGTLFLRTRTQGNSAIIEVSDTGTGMPLEVQRRCFEPFFSTKGAHGTGLGLAMVFGIVQRHHGEITVQSQMGRGTTFTVTLPGVPPETSAQNLPAAGQRPLRILFVDDEASSREVVSDYLSCDGHTVETASDACEALQRLRDQKFDLVITDKAMPGMTGDQLARTVNDLTPGLPVMLLTGFGDFMKAAGKRPEGVCEIVSKPATLGSLRDGIVRAMRSSGANERQHGADGVLGAN